MSDVSNCAAQVALASHYPTRVGTVRPGPRRGVFVFCPLQGTGRHIYGKKLCLKKERQASDFNDMTDQGIPPPPPDNSPKNEGTSSGRITCLRQEDKGTVILQPSPEHPASLWGLQKRQTETWEIGHELRRRETSPYPDVSGGSSRRSSARDKCRLQNRRKRAPTRPTQTKW